jgi:hypothetical protein
MRFRLVWVQILLAVLGSLHAYSAEALKIKNASEAMEASLSYLRERHPLIAPAAGIQWMEKTIYSDGPIDLVTTSKQFVSEAWIVEISQGLAPLKDIEYRIAIFSPGLGWYWEGSIKADGGIRERSVLSRLSNEEKQKKSEEFLRRSQTPAPVGGYGH